LVDGALGVHFRTGERFHQAVFSPDSSLAALEAFRSAVLAPCVYVDDPDIDVLIAETPSTCPAHVASLGSFSRAEDLDVGVVVRPCWRGIPSRGRRRLVRRGCRRRTYGVVGSPP
jgi:hypothetical protein